jgi:phosphoribosylglycinamide formyltransferase-1
MSAEGRVGILVSGRGSNMVALVEAMQRGEIAAEPAVVVSNRPSAAGLERARSLGVPTEVVSSRKIKPREAHERQIIDVLRRYRVDLVCLAGYMRLLSPLLVSEFRGRLLNIHPSLLPAFPGLEAQRQAVEYGVRYSGCTVHFVDEECDHGPIVLQAAVPVETDDDESVLAARILEKEHRLYVEAVRLYFEKRLRIEGRRVRVEGVVPRP